MAFRGGYTQIQRLVNQRSVCVWILVTLLASATALAQGSAGRLQGRVTDDSGGPLPGAAADSLILRYDMAATSADPLLRPWALLLIMHLPCK